MNDLSDENLVELIQKGDNDVFGEIIERYEVKMLRYARKFLLDPENAKDVVQDVFVKAYINIAGFDVSKKFSSWLYRIAHNCFINEIKKNSRIRMFEFSTDVFFPHLFSCNTADKNFLDNELRTMLDDCLNKIDIKYREVVVLFYYEGLDYKEIADILHIPVAAVGVRLSRGRQAMKKIFNH